MQEMWAPQKDIVQDSFVEEGGQDGEEVKKGNEHKEQETIKQKKGKKGKKREKKKMHEATWAFQLLVQKIS